MEKFLLIILILVLLYVIFNIKKNIEGFENAPAQSLGGVDDTNAINTLAQISKQLMTGGVTVPGNINIKDGVLDIKPSGDWGLGLSVTGGVKEAPYINFNNKADGKRNGFIMGAPDKFTLSNNVDVGGNLNVPGSISSGIDKWHTSVDGKNRTFYANNGHSFYGSGNGVHVFRTGANGGGADGLVIDSNSNVNIAGSVGVAGGITSAGRTVTPSLFKIWPMSRNAGECMKTFDDDRIGLAACANEAPQLWFWNGNQIRSAANNKCLTMGGGWGAVHNDNAPVVMRNCEDGARSQNWKWRDDHRLRNMQTGSPLRLPQTAASNAAANYNRASSNGADGWDWSCGNDCEMWFG